MPQCAQCSSSFDITASDKKFYDKVHVPAPTLCPTCREVRRFCFRNERKLYKRKCDASGKDVISTYAPDSPIQKVYENSVWWSDVWEALEYGRDFDFSRPFFDQFGELMCSVPHPAIWNWEPENSDYNNCCYRLKNSYMNFATDVCEDSYYNYLSVNCKSIMDCTSLEYSEYSYDCIDSDKLYHCLYCRQCRNCTETYLSFDCMDCDNCFGCSGLRHKKYYFFNEALDQKIWSEKVNAILGSRNALQTARQQFQKLLLTIPHRYAAIYNSENCTGNYLWNCKNATECFDVRKSEDIKYVTYVPWGVKETMDSYALGEVELGYEVNFGGIQAYDVQFALFPNHGPISSQYVVLCVNMCDHVFGCVGLKKKKYCIFNKQYTEDEYSVLREKIIAHMKKTGEWGQFFPESISPFGYNETLAHELYPLTKDEVLKRGWHWKDNIPMLFGKQTIQPEDVPDSIQSVPDTITQEIFTCTTCTKNFRILSQELKFYKEMQIPIPLQCPDCRHLDRIKKRNPRKLWQRQCMCDSHEHKRHYNHVCTVIFETTFAPERPERIYCADCYQEAII